MASFLVNRPHLSGSTFNNPSLMPISNQGLLNMDPHKQRACVHCRTTRTPLWRAGPAGPRSLCNACGIKYRKMKKNNNNVGVNKSGKGRKKLVGGGSLKVRVVGLGTEIVLHRSATAMADNGFPQPIGEEEQAAAMLLMALSSTYVRPSTT